jgi:hypothetical protein
VTFSKLQENRPLRELKRKRLEMEQRPGTQVGKMEIKKEGKEERKKTRVTGRNIRP